MFVSSTLRELGDERNAVREAITQLHLAPVMFELGARPHRAINLYRAYLEQSHIFIGIYWQSYGFVAPGMEISGLEDEYLLCGDKPKLIYIKTPATEREAGLNNMLAKIKSDDRVAYKYFSNAEELRGLVADDLAVLLTERFEASELGQVNMSAKGALIPNNLPAQVTSFIGREAEISAITEKIQQPKVRLLTLTGPGGTGKTRLSLQVAERLIDRFKDGVFFIPLAEANHPDLVISKIAEVFGVREGGSQSLLENLKVYLRDKNLLLLLDNFEQVLKAAPIVSGLLETAPQIKVLATSRALLHVRGEHEFQVPTLQLPERAAESTVEQLEDCESIRMFIERVQAIKPSFVFDESNAGIVGEICRRLDGLPLAIELAAARVKLFPPQKLVELLNHRLVLLTGGEQDLPERQQTLRKTLEWSVQLLTPSEQALFARLGVFIGGFSLQSVQEVCCTGKEADILQDIEALLNNSLIQVDTLDVDAPRFKMLETIREFAVEKLAESGELAQLKYRHAQFYIVKMSEVSPLFSTHEADRWLSWVDAERDNLRLALDTGLKDENLSLLAPWLLTSMNWPWYRRGFLSEGREWSDRLLQSPMSRGSSMVHCYALWSRGAMAMWQGDLNTALSSLEESVNIARTIELPMALAVTLLFLGTAHVNRGEDEQAIANLKEALELLEQLNMTWYQAITLVHIGNATLGMGKAAEARGYLDKASPISKQIGENWLTSFISNNYGEVARTEGNYKEAQRYYEESEKLLRSMGDKGDLARLVHNLGCVAQHTGDLSEAKRRFDESLAMFIKLGNQRGIAECMSSLASLWCEETRLAAASKLLGAAQHLLTATGAEWWPADRVGIDRIKQTLHEGLDADTFEHAWEAGQQMDLESAIAYARAGDKAG